MYDDTFSDYYMMYRSWGFSGVQSVIGAAWTLCLLPQFFGRFLPLFGLNKNHTSWADA